jgi:DNA-binding FrmR family transcriptional regulator
MMNDEERECNEFLELKECLSKAMASVILADHLATCVEQGWWHNAKGKVKEYREARKEQSR